MMIVSIFLEDRYLSFMVNFHFIDGFNYEKPLQILAMQFLIFFVYFLMIEGILWKC